MILQGILIICIIVVAAFIINGIEDHHKGNKMSFRESMDLTELPIITFYNGNTKINLLLDTGSSMNVINSKIIESLVYTKLENSGTVYGMEGNTISVDYISMNFTRGNDSYSSIFQVIDMQKAFDNIKEEYGAQIHGILGNSFFKEHKYMFDFDELVAYTKE